MIVDVNQEFRLKMMKMMKFVGKYARCDGMYLVASLASLASWLGWASRASKTYIKALYRLYLIFFFRLLATFFGSFAPFLGNNNLLLFIYDLLFKMKGNQDQQTNKKYAEQ